MATTLNTAKYMGMALMEDANGVWRIGGTNDVLYGGDMSGDVAGNGILLASADGKKHFAFSVYGDDGGTELAAGWVSAIFGSMVIYTAVTPSCNLSAFGVTGQIHIDASITTSAQVAGVYGVAETSGAGITVTATSGGLFGGVFGAVLASGDTLAADSYAGGILIGGNYAGTSTGKLVAIMVQNPSGDNFDAAFAFGQNAEYAGCGDATADASDDIWGHLKVYMGGTLCYINLFSDAS